MGMLNRMKDLKDMTEAAPGMVQQAPAGADFDPIAGVFRRATSGDAGTAGADAGGTGAGGRRLRSDRRRLA
jgi:hypothetical protein